MAKTMENSAVKPLVAFWSPPATVAGTEEGPGRPTVCIATTYTFSAELLEAELLPRFLGLEFDPAEREPAFIVEREDALEGVTAAVLVDQHTVDARQTTLRWDQVPMRVPRAVQHAKVTLLAWERLVRLIIGSANLTVPGYRHNREVVGVLDFFDHADSTPRQLIDDALGFLSRLLEFAAAEPTIISRVRGGLDTVTSRVRRWASIPRKFAAREYLKVYFVPTLPHADGRVARSTLKQVVDLWGNRTARDIRVVTPFVGNPGGSFRSVTSEVAKIPHTGTAQISLGIPGTKSEAEPRKRIAGLPAAFRDAWAEAWECDPEELSVCIVVPDSEHRGRPVERPLHAKALYVGNNDIALLCCGSSNFSPSGMGVGVANVEANLCYLDRAKSQVDGGTLYDRLPVDWQRDLVHRVEWPEAAPPSEEDADEERWGVPDFFRWATFDPVEHRLVIGLADVPLPLQWSISLSHPGSPVLASQDSALAAEGRLPIALPPEWRGVPITTLRVRWHDAAVAREALLPVHVLDRAQLPPPESLGSLTAEGILACLLAGCSPAEWVDRQAACGAGSGYHGPVDPAIDPHRFHDPSGLALYRVRRLGRGLAAMAQRIVGTVRTPEAVEYQLHRHPLGPIRLAEALCDEGRSIEIAGFKLREASHAFGLLEVALMLAHAGNRLHRLHRAGEADHRPRFRRAVVTVLGSAKDALPDHAKGAAATLAEEGLQRYCRSVTAQADELLGGLELQEATPCP